MFVKMIDIVHLGTSLEVCRDRVVSFRGVINQQMPVASMPLESLKGKYVMIDGMHCT